jgi:hypothetical protein
MESSLAKNHGNTSLSLNRQILQVARHQHIYSHFEICTRVPIHTSKYVLRYLFALRNMYSGTLKYALIDINGEFASHWLTTFINGR